MSEPLNASESPVREGDILAGKYRVEKILGVGGMGVVVAAMHTELDERVALKFLLPSAAQNPAVVGRFSREAKAAAKIKSQHVARVTDVGALENGIPYIVMEYLEGCDLSDLLARGGRLPAGIAVDYVLQASEAIAEAHAAGFVHRDLKPANLFLAQQSDGTAIIKVLDFGISKAVIGEDTNSNRGALTGTADVFGSPLYMSPEQLKSARDVDARADIWAIGIILYELISGVSPFDRPTVAETFGSILFEKPLSLRDKQPEVPEELDRIILRCLEKDANLRLSNVAELSKALFPFAENATLASLDRTARVLRRAGVRVDSVPPPGFPAGARSSMPSIPAAPMPLLVKAQARTSVGQSGGAQTRTAWDTAQIQGPRSGARTGLLIGGALLLAGAAVFGALRLRHTDGVAAHADHDGGGQRPPPNPPDPPAPTLASGGPAVTVEALPSSVPAAPSALAGTTPTVSSAPSVSPIATVAPAPHVPGPLRNRGGRGPRPGATGAAPTTGPVAVPAAKPTKPAEDTDGFGDRK